MKTFKLWVHQKTSFNGEELVINSKEFPNVKVNSIVEIYHPEDDSHRLLLQVRCLIDDFQQKETISIEQSIASLFQLRTYQDVIVNIVDPQAVALDLVELCFKDQYFGRSEMWRLANTLQGTCVYQNKKLSFSEMRVNVNEIWAKGEKMACGYITSDTKVVYRSSTAVVDIFFQMSQEMWEFDAVGDLYFEKANEFLKALFAKWSDKNCCHDVTIVMFSRTFYAATSEDDFPRCMKETVQEDHMGRFYEDFYRVVAQNERLDEWTSIIIELKKLFVGYRDKVLRHHCKCGKLHEEIQSYNSTAAQGNFLEVINMSLNVFKNYDIDRNFDRTGKVAMVVTAGAGVFEVNRELTNVTKQRTIDNGIGMDIVCMAEQPLHVVPLFRFHSKSDVNGVAYDYNLPHWINISFFQSASQIQSQSSSSFVPRIKLGLKTDKTPGNRDVPFLPPTLSVIGETSPKRNTDNFPFIDYDEYDAQVFKTPSSVFSSGWKQGDRSASVSKGRSPQKLAESMHKHRYRTISDDFQGLGSYVKRKSDPGHDTLTLDSPARNARMASDDVSFDYSRYSSQESLFDSESESNSRFVVGSDSSVGNKFIRNRKIDTSTRRTAPLINPFAPARMNIKITPNRRRWIHAFPVDPKGTTIRQHCHMETDNEDKEQRNVPQSVVEAAQLAVQGRKHRARLGSGSENDPRCSPGSYSTVTPVAQNTSINNLPKSASMSTISSVSESSSAQRKRTKGSTSSNRMAQIRKDWNDIDSKPGGWCFGPTGESEWSPSLTLGVDWKSLCIPALLPITTDYFPNEERLKREYCLFPACSLTPQDIFPEISGKMEEERIGMSASRQVFRELISQRISKGFQLITDDKVASGSLQTRRSTPLRQNAEYVEHKLSIGRIFHRVCFNGKDITVTRYAPMHSSVQIEITYKYRLQVTDAENYEPCSTTFANQQLEQFNWNLLDHYICSVGELKDEYSLVESFKFWRSRFFLLPAVSSATKKIIEGSERCDIYEEPSCENINQLAAGFLRFLETLNKIRRPGPSRRLHVRKVCVPVTREIHHTQDTSDIKPPEPKGRVRHPSVPTKFHTESIESNLTKSGVSSDSQRSSQASLAQNNSGTLSKGVPGTSSTDNVNSSSTLNIESSLKDILAMLQDPVEGISFLPSQAGLPSNCFVSGEAVTWVECCVEGVENTTMAIEILQRMIDEGLICHSSGCNDRPFIPGFVLYNIVPNGGLKYTDPGSLKRFQHAWCEVELDTEVITTNGPLPAFLMPSHNIVDMNIWGQTIAKNEPVDVVVDYNKKSDRIEWAVARYHSKYNPRSPFSLEIQWIVATGCILGDLVYSYFRKASSCGYHLLPVPVDQFVLPNSKRGDPLRTPIFIPLDLDCLKTHPGKCLFDEFGLDPSDHARRMLLFQHAILQRFGFLFDAYSTNPSTLIERNGRQVPCLKYAHCSGSFFVFTLDCGSEERYRKMEVSSPSKFAYRNSSSQFDFAGVRGRVNQFEGAGFFWAWNFMLSKRWRSANTGDDVFHDKMLSDFRKFCSNQDNRLKNFWDECWAKYWNQNDLNDDLFTN